ncbi:classical arabinogalactan protein 1-like [Forsythia ovata]|uniref:Classical arabinogalactan protein 1-like n=1 Tax=Forsythia ovata TaxID=205694 RepID=A0ABD1T462_9LAMI
MEKSEAESSEINRKSVMAIHIQILSVILFAFVFSIHPVFSADPPENSPSPSPHPPADALSPPPVLSPATPSQSPSPAPSPLLSSPPAPPPSDLSPSPSPAPSDSSAPDKSPTPAPAVADDAGHEEANASNMETERDSSSSGMNGGQKAGVAVAVVAGACIVGLVALIYKKRKHNVRRSEYGYAARREIL